MSKAIISTRLTIVLILVVGVVTHWQWIFLNSYFGWGDVQFLTRFPETWQEYIGWPSLWTTLINGLGEVDLVLSQYPIYSAFGMLTQLGLDTRLVAKLVFLWPIALLAPLGSFFLIRHFTRENLSALVGSVVYSYNVNFLMSQTGSLSLSAAYSLAPLSVFTFIKALEKKDLKTSLTAGLVFFFNAIHEFRIFYIIAFVLLFYFLYHLILVSRRDLHRLFVMAALPFIVLAVLSSYWLAPFITSGLLRTNPTFSRSLFGDQYMSLKQSVAFASPWWTAGLGYANGVVQPIPLYFWAIPFLAALGMLTNLKTRAAYWFLFLSLLGILLTKQSDHPFPNLYLWLYEHFPGFNAFREASKFFILQSFGYAGLIALLIAKLTHMRVLARLSTVLVCALFLVNATPFITGRIGGLFVPKNRPSDFETVKDFIHSQPDYFRSAWLPASGMWAHVDSLHPKINLHTTYFNTFYPVISHQPSFSPAVNRSQTIGDVNHQILTLFTQSFSNHLLDSLSIKYVIVPPKDTANDDDVFVNYGMPDREYLLSFLDQLKYLSRLDIGTSQTVIFENKDYLPLIYTTTGPVKYKFVGPSQYEISLKKSSRPENLIFTDSYNPYWTLTINGKSQPSTKINGLFNGFHIGAHDQDLTATLFFSPQKYVYIGSAVSLLGLLLVLVVYFQCPKSLS